MTTCRTITTGVATGRWTSLDMDCPKSRPVQRPDVGEVMEIVEAKGLYRHYERWAA